MAVSLIIADIAVMIMTAFSCIVDQHDVDQR